MSNLKKPIMKVTPEHNRNVIENFILHLTHCGNDEREPDFKEEITLTPKIMYQAMEDYIAEDHVDGYGNPEFDKEDDIYYCKKYPKSEALPDNNGVCSLCGGDCVDEEPYWVLNFIKEAYLNSEVTSGEFIHNIIIPDVIENHNITKNHVIKGMQHFLDWDGSPEEFDIIKIGYNYYTTQHNYELNTEYKGVKYPIRIFQATIDNEDDGWVHTYCIAPECLLDEMDKTRDIDQNDFEGEEANIDSHIYHYVEDEFFYYPLEYILKNKLDTPMTLVKE